MAEIERSPTLAPRLYIHFDYFPMPISANASWRNARGRMILSDPARAYTEAVRVWNLANVATTVPARKAIRDMLATDPALRLKIDTVFFFDRKKIICKDGSVKRNDTSNRLKPLHDALGLVLVIDDKHFWAGSFDKVPIAPNVQEYVTVTIRAL